MESGPDSTKLTLADLEDFEEATGADLMELEAELKSAKTGARMRILAALVWIYRRKSDPDFTLEAARAMPLDEVVEVAEELVSLVGAAPLGNRQQRRTKRGGSSAS